MSVRSTIHWSALIILFVCCSCAGSTKRRAVGAVHPIPSETDDFEDGEKTVIKLCPVGQLPHKDKNNNTVCCFPTACDPEHYIVGCSRDGGEDVCRPCPPTHRQPHSVSSSYMREVSCFEYIPDRHNSCAKSDHVLHGQKYSENCPYWCTCDTSRCFHGDPCHCLDIQKCGVGEEMDPDTNTCKKCPWFAYKHTEGCQRCQINITLWRLGDPHNPVYVTSPPTPPDTPITQPPMPPDKITTKDTSTDTPSQTESKEAEREDEESGVYGYVLPVTLSVIGILVIAILILCVAVMRGRSRHSLPQLVKGKISSWLCKCINRNDGRPRYPVQVSEPVTPATDTENVGLLDTYSEKSSHHVALPPSSPIAKGPTGVHATQIMQNVGDHVIKRTESVQAASRESNHRGEILYSRLGQEEPRMEVLKSVKDGSVNPIMRQTSYVVEVEINTDSSAGTPSDPEDVENDSDATKPLRNDPFKAAKRQAVQCPSIGSVSADAGAGLPVATGSPVESGIGLSLGPFIPDPNRRHGSSDCCRGEQDTLVASRPRVQPLQPLSTMDTSSPPPSIGQREVPGASHPSTIGNLPPLIIPQPAVNRADGGSTQLPTSPQPRICLPDGGTTHGRPCAAISPQPRTDGRVHDNLMLYNSGPQSSLLQNSNPTESVPSYVFLHQTLNNGSIDIAQINDISGDYSQPMYSDSQNNSISSMGRRSQNPPEGAEHDDVFMSVDDRENTDPKEIIPDLSGREETLCKYLDRDNTSPKVLCENEGISTNGTDSRDFKDKIIDVTECLGVDKKHIVAMTEDSSSVISGSRELIPGSGSGEASVVMEDNDSDIDKLMKDQSWSNEEKEQSQLEGEPVVSNNISTNEASHGHTSGDESAETDSEITRLNDSNERETHQNENSQENGGSEQRM